MSQPIEILLAEDNEDDVVMIKDAFDDAKLVNILNTVFDGEEALAYARQAGRFSRVRKPGMILLDISMPKKNGLEVLKELKEDPTLKHIPVVMLTTSKREVDIVQSYAYGACSFVSKPLTVPELREVVRHFEIYWAFVSRVPLMS